MDKHDNEELTGACNCLDVFYQRPIHHRTAVSSSLTVVSEDRLFH